MIDYARFTAAAVQAAPVYLDTAATVEKACGLIAEAALNGARLIVFPEVFVPGYPYWNWTMTPGKGSPWFERLFRAAIDIPGPEVDALRTAAQAAGAGCGHSAWSFPLKPMPGACSTALAHRTV